MTEQEKNQLTGLYAMYAAYYRLQISDQVLKMYAQDLEDLEFARVRDAMDSYRKNPKNRTLPLPSQIREIIAPVKNVDLESREIAANIQGAISKFGWNLPMEAKAFISEAGWTCVQRFGGWQYLCERLGVQIDMGTFQAQARDIIKAELLYASPKPETPALPSPQEFEEISASNTDTDWNKVLDRLIGRARAREDADDNRTGAETSETLREPR